MAAPTYLPTQYTSAEEMRQVCTDIGFELRAEAAPTDETAAWWVNQATGHVQFFLEKRYNYEQHAADLAANPWIRNVASVFACAFFFGRGGECVNETIAGWAEKMEGYLEEIKGMTADVPAYQPDNEKGTCPVLSGMAVDMTAIPALRVDRARSTGQPAGYTQRPFWPTRITGTN